MRIAQTHEQADFDALASLLGVYLLDEQVKPVLPRRLNRNVRAFLTIYGQELPFLEARDLPSEPIEMVTLVDTQSLTTLKGMGETTQIHIIDHHPLREDLPASWKITVSGTGANTTLFVESIQERDVPLNPIQATLLLMGIYEDTGSLTYYRTTPRDLRAAGYLLEQGASLQIAADFLNHPLSKAQEELYDQLRANAEMVDIHGYTVMVAATDAPAMDEEFSTVAHKLRDLLDPDALFVLVAMKGGVQMVARSTTANINVGEIAAQFGGGGHERAAAALIKDRTIKEVRQELLRILPEAVKPSLTVAQIMSHSPHLLSPDTTVEDAAQRMQRYGYEGFPVVEQGRVVGLLTRRAVDRALMHKYPVSIRSIMDAGEYSVTPDDSVEHLQRVMTETGWGQIPVVQPETGKIIGIVTRTDLIKSLAMPPRRGGRLDFTSRLESALPPARLQLLKVVSQMAFEQHAALYIVGGFVRDLWLNRPSLDFDLVVEGDAINLARALARRYGGRVTSHARFGTAKWHLPKGQPPAGKESLWGNGMVQDELPDSLDFVSARTEFYAHPTALPTVERGSIKLDLHRRDFTINTLALRLDGHHYGELYDYWGGLADLRHGVVRVLHSLSFVDDPTRMLRAVRFEQRFNFKIERRTGELLLEAVPLLSRLSGDRLRHELDHILLEDRAIPMLSRLHELGLLTAIHPALTWDDWLKARFEMAFQTLPEPEWQIEQLENPVKYRLMLAYMLWLIRLNTDSAKSIVSRLKFPTTLAKAILSACTLWKEMPSIETQPPSHIVERLEGIPSLALFAVFLALDDERSRNVLQTYVKKWRHVRPSISGHDLRRFGIPPGPKYRHILTELRNAWLDGQINNHEQETQLLSQLCSEVMERHLKSQAVGRSK